MIILHGLGLAAIAATGAVIMNAIQVWTGRRRAIPVRVGEAFLAMASTCMAALLILLGLANFNFNY